LTPFTFDNDHSPDPLSVFGVIVYNYFHSAQVPRYKNDSDLIIITMKNQNLDFIQKAFFIILLVFIFDGLVSPIMSTGRALGQSYYNIPVAINPTVLNKTSHPTIATTHTKISNNTMLPVTPGSVNMSSLLKTPHPKIISKTMTTLPLNATSPTIITNHSQLSHTPHPKILLNSTR
jgi:hypothetical protein